MRTAALPFLLQLAAAQTCPTGGALGGCLVFSAYVEGTQYNKLFDVQNRCGHNITLGDFDLATCGNGCTHWEHSIGFQVPYQNFLLAPHAVWRIANEQASAEILATADQTNQYLSNGNDLHGIRHLQTSAIIDTLGPMFPGLNVPDAWAVAGVAGATKDHTLVRKPSVTSGNCGLWAPSAGADANSSEWLVYPRDTLPAKDGTTSASPVTSGSSGTSPSPSSPSPSSSCPHLHDCPAPTATVRPDRRQDRSRLVVATWNAEWLFDGVCDPSASPWTGGTGCVGHASGLNQCNAVGASAHTARAAEVLRRMNADVINLVEVEGCDMLAICAALLNADAGVGTANAFGRYLVEGTDTFLRQQVGLITRLQPSRPLVRTGLHEAFPIDAASTCGAAPHGSSGISKHYIARLQVEGLPHGRGGNGHGPATLVVVGLHLKAIPTQPRSCHQREAQAKVAQGILTGALAESPYVVVMGDLNDFDGDACCVDVAGSTPTSRVLRMLKNPDNAGEDELHSVISMVPQAERYTDWWDHAPADGIDGGTAEHSSLDHMLVSTPLYAALSAVHIDHTHQPMDVSDHWPIIATFDLTAFAAPPAPPPTPMPPPKLPPLTPSSPSSAAPSSSPESVCLNTCRFPSDADCDDGGEGSEYSSCAPCEDCDDCGPRPRDSCARPANPLPPPSYARRSPTPLPPPPPAPPVPTACLATCMGHSCLWWRDELATHCSALGRLGCDCQECCVVDTAPVSPPRSPPPAAQSSTPAAPPPSSPPSPPRSPPGAGAGVSLEQAGAGLSSLLGAGTGSTGTILLIACAGAVVLACIIGAWLVRRRWANKRRAANLKVQVEAKLAEASGAASATAVELQAVEPRSAGSTSFKPLEEEGGS